MKNLLLFIVVFVPFYVFSQKDTVKKEVVPEKVKWYTIQEAYSLSLKQPKKIFIDAYTDWCGWCKVMDANTFTNPLIVEYLNKYFYPVKLNAETKEVIKLGDKIYKNEQTGARPPHQLAIELLGGQMSFPTTIYLDERFNKISAVPGYLAPEQIEPILLFFAWNVFTAEKYEVFMEHFKSKLPPKN